MKREDVEMASDLLKDINTLEEIKHALAGNFYFAFDVNRNGTHYYINTPYFLNDFEKFLTDEIEKLNDTLERM